MPLPSPTTTRAVKLKRRPPWTTLATRLMVTTRSRYAVPLSAPPRRSSRRSRRSPPPPPRRGAAITSPLYVLARGQSPAVLARGGDPPEPPGAAAAARLLGRPFTATARLRGHRRLARPPG